MPIPSLLTPFRNVRQLVVVIHDAVMTCLAVLASFYVRFDAAGLEARWPALAVFLPLFAFYASLVYSFFSLYRAKWRFASLPDLSSIFRAVTVLALSLLVLDYILASSTFYNEFFFGKVTIALYWVFQIFLLGGPRIAYRYYRYARTRHGANVENATPALVLGRAHDAEVVVRAFESGAIKKLMPIAILSPNASDHDQSLRAVPVLGGFDLLEATVAEYEARGLRIGRLIVTPSALAPEAAPDTLLARARKLGLPISRMQPLEEGGTIRLAPIEVEDLLLRPTVAIDFSRLEAAVGGRRVLVTGGGGSIGAEICERVVAHRASHLMVVENAEPALHAVLETLAALDPATQVEGRIGDVRERARMDRLMAEFKPDLVFHAAALKHVPYLEADWIEGVKTNILGSVNVAEAAVAAGARAMVMISTDKAIEPVSVLGATKRFAEMYCQALDAELASGPTRLIAVRFGNVLGSNGSVVPKFKAQIAAGGPVTVTHPDMVRYFMTIREACNLVVTAASHALAPHASPDQDRISVYVLNMGQPVKILDLAERMIRLSGLEPGRDIEVAFTGVRPGERLNEILFAREEPTADIGIPGVVAAQPVFPPLAEMRRLVAEIEAAVETEDRARLFAAVRRAVTDFAQGPAAKPAAPAPAGAETA
ncbi:capsular polysaccharide biosynthesis protein [Blastochloris tepida]|uniref:Capsular polysaccharide biosynthesis protein n=2 Tax=Blastochloris tepida TaxID=2233851 RepID=A0A348G433_9HYPH|nr:capsular polysaccharide biosynthesis protein [Blastochloris tepida]